MSILLRLPSTLAAVLVAAALVAPMAVARPFDVPKAGRPGSSERAQALRASRLPSTSEAEFRASAPVFWSYESPGPGPATEPAYADGGTPWMTIGLVIAAACFLVAAGAAVAARDQLRPGGV